MIEKSRIQSHLETLDLVSRSRKWFKNLMDKEPKTREEEQLITEITFHTDLAIASIHEREKNKKNVIQK